MLLYFGLTVATHIVAAYQWSLYKSVKHG